MAKIICVSCSKQIKVPVQFLQCCKSCHKPVCKPCTLNGFCRDCGLFMDRNTIIEEYFADKYETKKEETNAVQY